jgi:hypothetical protein
LSYLISISKRNATNWQPVRRGCMLVKGEEEKQQQKVPTVKVR